MNVFYDPALTNEAELLDLIIKRDCPRARRTVSADGHLLNSIIAPGDPVQVAFLPPADTKLDLANSVLPAGWQLRNLTEDSVFVAEQTGVLTLSTPGTQQAGPVPIRIAFTDGNSVDAVVDVVSQVGRH